MASVTIQRRSANVVVKAVGGVFQQATTSGVTLNNQGAAAVVNRLDGLADVVEGNPQNGAVLTYNAADDKYYVQPISVENQNLDGGTF